MQIFRLMQDPRTKQVTRISLQVFICRFIPEFNLKAGDGDCLFRYLGISKAMTMDFSYLEKLVYPEGRGGLVYVESELELGCRKTNAGTEGVSSKQVSRFSNIEST